MADISVERKKGGEFTWIWAGAAILAVVGLMAWLFTTQPTTTQVVTGPAGDTAAEAESTAQVVNLAEVGANPDAFAGREVRVENATVAAVLGNRGYWADVPGANPFLVIIDPTAGDAGWIAGGASRTLEGTVHPVTDEELETWVLSQAIRPEARDEASFATHYLRATRATP
jgi:hypothetical protein